MIITNSIIDYNNESKYIYLYDIGNISTVKVTTHNKHGPYVSNEPSWSKPYKLQEDVNDKESQ